MPDTIWDIKEEDTDKIRHIRWQDLDEECTKLLDDLKDDVDSFLMNQFRGFLKSEGLSSFGGFSEELLHRFPVIYKEYNTMKKEMDQEVESLLGQIRRMLETKGFTFIHHGTTGKVILYDQYVNQKWRSITPEDPKWIDKIGSNLHYEVAFNEYDPHVFLGFHVEGDFTEPFHRFLESNDTEIHKSLRKLRGKSQGDLYSSGEILPNSLHNAETWNLMKSGNM